METETFLLLALYIVCILGWAKLKAYQNIIKDVYNKQKTGKNVNFGTSEFLTTKKGIKR